MENELISGLNNIGLNDKQAQVYLALLRLGRGSAYAVSEQSGLKKPTTYVILDELVDKGAAHRVPRVSKRLYKPVLPEVLLRDAEQRLIETKKLLPSLKSQGSSEPDKMNVLHFEGLKAFKEALYYRMDECVGKEIIGFYAKAEGMSPKLLAVCEEYNKYCADNDVTLRVFVPEHPSLEYFRKTDLLYKRIVQILPLITYSSAISIDTFANVVRIILNRNNQIVIIENIELAKTIREIFDFMWKNRSLAADTTKARG